MYRLCLLVALLLVVPGCGGDDGDERDRPAPSRFAAAARTAVAAVGDPGVIVLDVRSDEEVAEGRAREAVPFPLTDLEAGLLPDIPKDARVFVYCRTGRRAGTAADILRRNGFEDVTNIGGLTDWRAAGGRVVS